MFEIQQNNNWSKDKDKIGEDEKVDYNIKIL